MRVKVKDAKRNDVIVSLAHDYVTIDGKMTSTDVIFDARTITEEDETFLQINVGGLWFDVNRDDFTEVK